MSHGERFGGTSIDWAKGVNDIKFSIAMELRPRNTWQGLGGLLLPPEQIVPTGEEVWAFHLTVVRELLEDQTAVPVPMHAVAPDHY